MPEDFAEALNSSQREAVTFEGSGPLLVLAGPGSGKTHVLTQRVRYLTEVLGVIPEKILVLTFTRDAAISMKERYFNAIQSVKRENVSQAVKQNDVSQTVKQTIVSQSVNFGTFHSVFYQILKQSTGIRDKQMLTDAEKKRILLPILDKVLPNLSFLEKNGQWLELMPVISFYKNTGDLKEAVRRLLPEVQVHFEEIYQDYETKRRQLGKLDFDDMLTDCRKMFCENTSQREYWQERFSHILIDEFQDVNPAQYEIVKLLSKAPHNIFAVGDDDQSIYGFRGADPSCMKRFAEEFQAKQIVLNVNYRSVPEIVGKSSKLIGHNRDRFAKSIRSYREEGESFLKTGKENGKERNSKIENAKAAEGVFQKGFTDRDQELSYVIQTCEEFLKKDGRETMAILFRTNRNLQRMAFALKARGIPFAMRERLQNPYQNEYVADVMAYLRLAHDEGDVTSLSRIVNKPSRYVTREALAYCREAWQGEGDESQYTGEGRQIAGEGRQIAGEGRQIAGDGRQIAGDGRQIAGEGWQIAGEGRQPVEKGWRTSRDRKEVRQGAVELLAAYYQNKNDGIFEQCRILLKHLQTVKKLSPYTAVQYVRRVIGYDGWIRKELKNQTDLREEALETLEWLTEEAKMRESVNTWLESLEDEAGGGMQRNRERIMQSRNGKDLKEKPGERLCLMTVHASKGLEFDRVMIPDVNERNYPRGSMQDDKSLEEERRIFYVGMTRAKTALELLYVTGTEGNSAPASRFLRELD